MLYILFLKGKYSRNSYTDNLCVHKINKYEDLQHSFVKISYRILDLSEETHSQTLIIAKFLMRIYI